MKKYLTSILKYVGSISAFAVSLSANTTSTWISHQPKVPEGVRKFKKIN
ncbi:autoinducer prepeptide [Gottschalkia acidurici 9a]|uniref:Autoinducer prepeptide n=1 Tax=Gottschalkia acidurici (strain ATCC 7906 / DSM 604 / BCRC 14475 / CIP 104303 / KCTC 5404 / NCIMB 10678 / 9a) TaxID=1128398 RepID=K0AWK5_GOTA9|nr:cyclic lactone autoinducer peptide [Gottschalkia acidurici]AFS77147.1 autoinducer prepeptide [Gottschalkia acidurici 9a]